MVTIKKKDKNWDRGVAVGANLGLIGTVVAAVRGYFAEKRHQRELARRKRERKMKMARATASLIRTLTYLLPIIIALLKAARLVVDIRKRKQNEKEEPEEHEVVNGIEIIPSEPVVSEDEVFEKANSEAPNEAEA
ncbi:MAG: hypothetical protein LIO72_04970 [Ruminococcus sp.]|nr:hypothetical protein [Ruminococcus sp.]